MNVRRYVREWGKAQSVLIVGGRMSWVHSNEEIPSLQDSIRLKDYVSEVHVRKSVGFIGISILLF